MKVRIIALILAFSFLGTGVLLAGGGEKASLIEKKYLSGRQYFREGNYAAAIKQFEEVIKIDPNYKVAAEYLKMAEARILAKSKKGALLSKRLEGLGEVAKEKEAAKAERESSITRMKGRWQTYLANEREKKRIKEEKKKELARLKREKELAHYYGIDELENISQKTQAMIAKAEEKKALQEKKEQGKWGKIESLPSSQKDKAMARIYMARAEAAYRDGNYDEAIKEWEKVSAADPSNSAAGKRIESVRQMIERNKGLELEKARQESIAEARAAFDKYCLRAGYLCARKDYKGSIGEFQKALAIDPNCKEARNGLLKAEKGLSAKNLKISKIVSKGNKYLWKNKFVKAKKLALEALEIDPDSSEAKALLENADRGLAQK